MEITHPGGHTAVIHGKDVAPYESVLQRLDRVALSSSDTRTIIDELLKGL
jgi:hypothetical protein